MATTKPLLREEIPEKYQNLIRYVAQYQREVHSGNRIKMATVIPVLCQVCHEYNDVPVNDIRNWARGKRKQFPGTHRVCRYPGTTTRKDGYVMLYKPKHPNAVGSGYVMEHVIVMEESLGRYLDRDNESIHHINGDKSDNRLDNLQLRQRYHGKGQAWTCLDCGSHNVQASQLHNPN